MTIGESANAIALGVAVGNTVGAAVGGTIFSMFDGSGRAGGAKIKNVPMTIESTTSPFKLIMAYQRQSRFCCLGVDRLGITLPPNFAGRLYHNRVREQINVYLISAF